MPRPEPPAMITPQHVLAVLSLLLLAVPRAAPAAAGRTSPPWPVVVISAQPAHEIIIPRAPAARLPVVAPGGGYVRLRDGRRVAAISRHDLLQFRRTTQPDRLLLKQRVQRISSGRVVIAYSSALTAGPPSELPSADQPPQRLPPPDKPRERLPPPHEPSQRLPPPDEPQQPGEPQQRLPPDKPQRRLPPPDEPPQRLPPPDKPQQPDEPEPRLPPPDELQRRLAKHSAESRPATLAVKSAEDEVLAEDVLQTEGSGGVSSVRQYSVPAAGGALAQTRGDEHGVVPPEDVTADELLDAAEGPGSERARPTADGDGVRPEVAGAETPPKAAGGREAAGGLPRAGQPSRLSQAAAVSETADKTEPEATAEEQDLPVAVAGHDAERDAEGHRETEVGADGRLTSNVGVLLSMANGDAGGAMLDGGRPSHPATRGVHGPHVADASDGRAVENGGGASPPTGGRPADSDVSQPDSDVSRPDSDVSQPDSRTNSTDNHPDSDFSQHDSDLSRPDSGVSRPDSGAVVAPVGGGRGRPVPVAQNGASGADTVRREARGPRLAATATLLGTAEISAVAVGCVMVTAVVIMAAALMVQRSGMLKRRSILSDPPLDDTRLSYINASTDFSVSELGDEMTNLDNLDNDSFLNSLESMTDSVAAQTCWSREVRHSKL